MAQGFFHRKIPHLKLVANTFYFHSLELIFAVLAILLWHLLLYLPYLLFYHGIFTCTNYFAVAHFIHIYCISYYASETFLVKLSYFFVITCFSFNTN